MTQMAKKTRKNIEFALRQLLRDGTIGTHEGLCQALEKQGYEVNQPKISRLLHKLGAIKVTNEAGENIYRLPHEHGLMHEMNFPTAPPVSFKQWLLDISHNGSLIVIHTTPGAANMLAREIDLHQLKLGILGTIAGDDTIFIAPKKVKEIGELVEGIKKLLGL
jgi:transcriptional regulator of arginine metabolism